MMTRSTFSYLFELQLMNEKNLSGIPIVDDRGRLLGQVTSAALHPYIVSRVEHPLDVPIKQFAPNLSLKEGHNISIKTTTKLKDAVKQFSIHKTHRLFLVDGEGRPIGVCSLKNLLAAMIGLHNVSN